VRTPLRPLVALVVIGAALLVVPAPAPAGPATGTITARAAGDRDPATGDPVPLAGAVLGAFGDAARSNLVGACTTDATGSCVIPDLAPGAYWVAPVDDPPGGQLTRLGLVTTSLGGTQEYAEAVVVEEGDPVTRRFVYRRANPAFPARCGVSVTLLYDVSGSISASEAATMQAASTDFVDALAGTPSSIAIASFATHAPAAGNTDLPPTSVADATGVQTVKQAIHALSRPDGDARYTNWDAAFRSVVGQSDIVVLFTDGNPTVHGVPAQFPPVLTGLDQLEAGVLSANAVKAAGARVMAVGVGSLDALSKENLALVSGPDEGRDYAVTSFADVHTVFRALADALCPRPEPTTPELPVVPRFTG
jgi:hypothetical protein